MTSVGASRATSDDQSRAPGEPARLDWAATRSLATSLAQPRATESVALDAAIGRTLAVDVQALIDVPHYASSAMDGWAVAGAAPWRLLPAGSGQQGDAAGLRDGQAVAVVTGGVVIAGADSVVPTEHARVDDGLLTPARTGGGVTPNRHIRPAGEEARQGQTVIAAPCILNPVHMAVAAMAGHDTLTVFRQPRVAMLFTGDEVDTAGVPPAGRVRDTFGPQLPAVARMLGATVRSATRCRDSLDSTVEALRRAADGADLVLTTGGTARSAVDFLRPALQSLQATLVIDGIAMRPGGPTMVGRLPGGTLVVCLPGNPLAAMMAVFTVVEPLIASFSGREPRPLVSVRSADAVAGRPQTTVLAPCAVVDGVATVSTWRSSGMMRGLAEADGVMVIGEGGVAAGGSVEVLGLPWAAGRATI